MWCFLVTRGPHKSNAVEAEWLAINIINAELNCFLLFDETYCTQGIYKYSYSYLWLTKTSCLVVTLWWTPSLRNCTWFPEKRKCKQNFVTQLCVVDLGCLLGNSGQMHVAIVLWTKYWKPSLSRSLILNCDNCHYGTNPTVAAAT